MKKAKNKCYVRIAVKHCNSQEGAVLATNNIARGKKEGKRNVGGSNSVE
jgi:hypothetical protein